MKVEEVCNDVYAVDIVLEKEDLKKIRKGKLIHFECIKSDTEIYITMER
tara:strand:+ start:634 stop:780 length:147 start_codon:yes stop_codon:yes gene_type:complete